MTTEKTSSPRRSGADWFGLIAFAVLVICSAVLVVRLISTKFLPTGQLLLAVGALLVLSGLHGWVQLPHREKTGGKIACGIVALVLAAAGLKRLGLEERITRYFTVEELLPRRVRVILALQTPGGGGAVLPGRRTGRRRNRLRPDRACLCPRPGRGLLRSHRGPRPAGGRYRDHRRTVCNRRGRSAAGAAQRPPRPGGALGEALARRLKEGGTCLEK